MHFANRFENRCTCRWDGLINCPQQWQCFPVTNGRGRSQKQVNKDNMAQAEHNGECYEAFTAINSKSLKSHAAYVSKPQEVVKGNSYSKYHWKRPKIPGFFKHLVYQIQLTQYLKILGSVTKLPAPLKEMGARSRAGVALNASMTWEFCSWWLRLKGLWGGVLSSG